MSEWKRARKKPVVVEFREVNPDENQCCCASCIQHPSEYIDTLEGRMRAIQGFHLIIKGVDGELYPIDKEIFEKTYDVLPE